MKGCASWACWLKLLSLLLLPTWASAWEAPRFQADWATRFSGGGPEGILLLRFATADLWFADENGRCTAELDVRIQAVTPEGRVPWAGSYRRSLAGDDRPAHRLEFRPAIEPGSYELRVAVTDLRGGGMWTGSLNVVSEGGREGWRLATVLLTEPQTGTPWVGDVAPTGESWISWQTQLLAPRARAVELKTTFFRKEESAAAEMARPYLSVLEHTEVLSARTGVQVLRRSLRTEGLEPGEYLLLVQVFETEKLVTERSRRVVLRWPEAEAVIAHVDRSIEELAPVVPEAALERLRRLGSEADRRAAFLHFWQERASDPIGYPTEEMERYYRRVRHVDTLLAEGRTPGHRTDRGCAWLRYGPPARVENAKTGQGELLRWHYPRFRLTLVFRKEGESWREAG